MTPTKTRLPRRIALALALLAPAAAPAQHFPPDDDLRTMLRYLVEDGEARGIVLGVLEADGSTRIVAYGSGGAGARPLGPRSVFEIGSITKVFTGTLLADAVERGEVSLSDPVARHLPEGVTVPSRNGRQITLLDLATHRSALPRMPGNLAPDAANPYPAYTMEQMYAFLAQHELRRDVGAEFEYSNMGVALLGQALARAAGRGSYDELVRERVLEPLGMRMTGTVVEGAMAEWNTQGHYEDGRVAPYRGWAELPGMGALRSNAEDLLRFLAANTGPPASRLERVMRDAHQPRAATGERGRIGLNWLIHEVGGRTILMHGGTTVGYETQIAFDPERGVGVVLLTNTGEFDDNVALDLLRRAAGPARPEARVSRDLLRRYAGVYETPPGRPFHVRLEDEGYLTLQMPPHVRFRMYAESDSTFSVKRMPWRVRFTRDGGRVSGVVVDVDGTERTARRVGDSGLPPAVVAENAALDLPLTAEQMARYEGTYLLQSGQQTQEMRVFVQDGHLMSQPGSQRPRRLLYQGNHEFRPDEAFEFRVVFTFENGRAEAVALSQGDRSYGGRRRP